VAPGFEPEALEILTQKKNLRIIVLPSDFAPNPLELRQVSGGFLLQDADRSFAPAASSVSCEKPSTSHGPRA